MTTAARPRDRLIAAVVLSAVIGLVGGGLAAWGIYARFGPVERVTQQTIVGGSGGGSGAHTAGSIAQAKSVSVVEVDHRAGDRDVAAHRNHRHRRRLRGVRERPAWSRASTPSRARPR